MTDTNYPRLSVTVTVFTAFDHSWPKAPASAQLHQGPNPVPEFGMSLWALTRKANSEDTYQATPTGRRVLPASMVGPHESLVECAKRIMTEELGIDVSYRLRQNRIFDDVDPASDTRVISVNFWAFVHINALAPLLGGKDQVGLELVSSRHFLDNWDALTKLEKFDGVSRFGVRFAQDQPHPHRKQLTHDLWGERTLEGDHDDMVFYAWREMRYGFTGRFDPFRFIESQVLGATFRLSELRELYEVVRGQKIQADQFRRLATGPSGFVEEVGTLDSSRSRPGKPAALFRLLPWAVPERGYTPPEH
jgi:ADP-ribose pyrophosphatase YjhB (NUDIX family)